MDLQKFSDGILAIPNNIRNTFINFTALTAFFIPSRTLKWGLFRENSF